jgi:hypothetical protein
MRKQRADNQHNVVVRPRFNFAGIEHLIGTDAMCPGSSRPGWRAPLCG